MPRKILLATITFALTIAHWLYAWKVSLLLYQSSGGIRKLPSGWTEFGGATHAWTIPLQIPGTLLMRFGEQISGDGSGGSLGWWLVLAASVATAYAVASLMTAMFSGQRAVCGKFYWRVFVILLGTLWIPVREDWAAVYQYTVLF